MSNILSFEQKEDFYIRLYFNTTLEFDLKGIRRAYLDFNRTLPVKDKNKQNRDEIRIKTEEFLKEQLTNLITEDFKDYKEFDLHHEQLCKDLQKQWSELTIGHAQKWINMSLKYWLVFGEKRIKKIEKNVQYFHIPIDSIVLSGLVEREDLQPWSQMDDYKKYLRYQCQIRDQHEGLPPIIVELDYFNKRKE